MAFIALNHHRKLIIEKNFHVPKILIWKDIFRCYEPKVWDKFWFMFQLLKLRLIFQKAFQTPFQHLMVFWLWRKLN